MSRFKFITIMFLYLNATSILAQDGSAGLAGEFLRWGIGARALGMGHAYMALATDATAGYWNPAGLVEIPVYGFFDPLPKRLWSSFKFATSHHQLLEEITFCNINVSTSLCRYGTLGFGYLRLGTDDIQGWAWDSQGFPMRTNEYLFYHEAKLVSWGGRLLFWPTLDIGVTAKCLHNKISDYGKRFQGGGMDLGLRLGLNLPEILGIDFYKLDLGLKWQNFIEWNRHLDIGNELYFSSLMGGLAWLPKKIWLLNFSSKFRPRFAFDFEYMESRKEDQWQWRNGLELDWQVLENIRFLLRTGLQSDKLCCGFGINWDGFALDLSHKKYSDIDFANSGQVSFSYQENKKSTTNFLNLRKYIIDKNASASTKKWFWFKIIDEAIDPILITGAYMELAELENSRNKNSSALKYYQKFQQNLLAFDSIPLKELGFVKPFSFEQQDLLLMIFVQHIIKCDSQDVKTIIKDYQTILSRLASQNKDQIEHELREAYFGVVADSFGVKRQDEPEKWLRKLASHKSISESFRALFKLYLGRHYNKISEPDSALKYFDQIIVTTPRPEKVLVHDSLNIISYNKKTFKFFCVKNALDTDALDEWISCLEQNPEKRKQIINKYARKQLSMPDDPYWSSIQKRLAKLKLDTGDKVSCESVQLKSDSLGTFGRGYPWDMAFIQDKDAMNIYVSEPNQSIVQRIIKTVTSPMKIEKSDPITEVSFARGLAVFAGKVYICTKEGIVEYVKKSNKIQPKIMNSHDIFTANGATWYVLEDSLNKLYYGNIDSLKSYPLVTKHAFKWPVCLAVEASRQIVFIADYESQRINTIFLNDSTSYISPYYRGAQWWPVALDFLEDRLYVLYWNLIKRENDIIEFKLSNNSFIVDRKFKVNFLIRSFLIKSINNQQFFYAVEFSKNWRIYELKIEAISTEGKK